MSQILCDVMHIAGDVGCLVLLEASEMMAEIIIIIMAEMAVFNVAGYLIII